MFQPTRGGVIKAHERDFLSDILCLLTAAMCLWAAQARHGQILEQRAVHELVQVTPLENAPPLVAFTTVALGGFRGLIADLLWMRASRLQDEGKYFELVQLADWITKLEPRFTGVWAYHAWNMAYNVSIMFEDNEERWRWVVNGIQLLRDSGIFYNSGDPQLYKELGDIYKQKIGGITSEKNQYFKRMLAKEMSELLGGGYIDYDQLDPALAKRMIKDHKLDPKIMREIDEEYGPLDWRAPSSHSLYWAYRGSRVAGPGGHVQCDRLINHSLIDAFEQGRILLLPESELVIHTPNIDILPNVIRAYERSIARHENKSFPDGFVSFLKDAIIVLYSFNRKEQARETHQLLLARNPDEEIEKSFSRYVYINSIKTTRAISETDATMYVEGAFYKSFFWLALGEEERAKGYDAMARTCWKQFMKAKTPEMIERMGLAPAGELRKRAMARAMGEFGEPLSGRLKLLAEKMQAEDKE